MSPSVTKNNGLPVPIMHSRVVLLLSKRQAQRVFNCLRMPLPQAKHPIICYFYQLARTMICTIFLLNFSHPIICLFSELCHAQFIRQYYMESHWALCSYIIILRTPILSPQTDPDALSSQDLHYSSSPALQPQPSMAKARQEGRHLVSAI